MKLCDFCGNPKETKDTCPHCGKFMLMVTAHMIFTPDKKGAPMVEMRITDKYLILRSLSGSEVVGGAAAGAAFGVLGVVGAAVVDSTRSKCYAYYELSEIRKLIYPYFPQKHKSKTGAKIIFADGSDVALNFDTGGLLFSVKNAGIFADTMAKVGIPVEDGTGQESPVWCERPAVNAATYATRLCPSAAQFVKAHSKNIVVPAIGGGYQQPAPAPVAPSQPVYQQPAPAPVAPSQPVYQQPAPAPVTPIYDPNALPSPPPVEVPVQVVNVAVSPSAQAVAPQPVSAPSYPMESKNFAQPVQEQKFCSQCGTLHIGEAVFCRNCGHRM